MTSEGAKKYIETLLESAQEGSYAQKWLKEINEALSAEPCEDAISRQAVLDLVVANHTELNGLNVVMYSPLYKDIKQLPTVNPTSNVSIQITEREKYGRFN